MQVELENNIFRNNDDFINQQNQTNTGIFNQDEINKRVEETRQNLNLLKGLDILKSTGLNLPNVDRQSKQSKQSRQSRQTQQIQNPLQDKINSSEFNIEFEKVFLDKLTVDYNVSYYGVYNLKIEKIEKFSNSNIITKFIEKNIKVTKNKVNIVEYQSPIDILLDGQLENGGIEIDIKYKDIALFNDTILLDDYKYGSTVEDKMDFIKDFIPKMKQNYIDCLAYIFENMKISDK
jgi:hypothetical protein